MPLCETKKQSSVPREVTVHYCIQYTLASNFRAVVVNVWIPRSYITASNNQQHIKRCHIHIFFAQAVALSPCLCTQYGFVGTSEWGDQNRFKHCKHAQRHSLPCSWDLWSLTGAQDTSSSAQPGKELFLVEVERKVRLQPSQLVQ